jgi:hypothetical protein
MHLTSWVKSSSGEVFPCLDFDLENFGDMDRLAEYLNETTGMRWEISLWGEYVGESAGGVDEAGR